MTPPPLSLSLSGSDVKVQTEEVREVSKFGQFNVRGNRVLLAGGEMGQNFQKFGIFHK
jgi:hypothetical protein